MEVLRRVDLKRPVERVGFIWRIQGREGLQAGDSKDDGYGTRTRRLDCGLWMVTGPAVMVAGADRICFPKDSGW